MNGAEIALLAQLKKERDPVSFDVQLWFHSPPSPTPEEIAAAKERQRFLLVRLRRDLRAFLKLEAQLAECVYLALHCALCGEVRLAQAGSPAGETVPCPVCRESHVFTMLGAGVTRRRLPFFEIFRGESVTADGHNRIPWDELTKPSRGREE